MAMEHLPALEVVGNYGKLLLHRPYMVHSEVPWLDIPMGAGEVTPMDWRQEGGTADMVGWKMDNIHNTICSYEMHL